jgi:hypothetical protein
MVRTGRPPYRRTVRFHRKKAEPPAAPTDYSSRLHGLAPLGGDDDGRPTGEDRHTYDLLPESYVEPVEAPEWLKPHHGRHRREDPPGDADSTEG